MTEQKDLLLCYCIAFDACNFELLGKVLSQAQRTPGGGEAITDMHQRFDTNESFTQQLQAYRQQLQGATAHQEE